MKSYRVAYVWHIGTDYLSEIAKNWYDYLVSKGVYFKWETKVTTIDFDNPHGYILLEGFTSEGGGEKTHYMTTGDELIFAVGKSGIDFAQQLAQDYKLPDEPKSVQIGVRFEAPQHHFQKLIDISYDFKLYRKFEDKGVSLRSFCTNNNAAYVAVEETYGDYSYNGHAKKDPRYKNDMTNFGILMEINGIEDPFEWSRNVVNQCNLSVNIPASYSPTKENLLYKAGLYYSPGFRQPSFTSENEPVRVIRLTELSKVEEIFQGYFSYITDFIDDMKKVFPTLEDDYGIYIPEVKYLSPEPLVNYNDLSLTKYPNVHFVGDALSARGITVSGAHGIYVAESLI